MSDPPDPTQSSDQEPTTPDRPTRVLVVDDDEDIRTLVATYLSLESFDVVQATNGHEAVKVAVAERPDLILMDIMMPEMSGSEAATVLRQDIRTSFTPIIFLSAKSMVQDKIDHLLSGADDYIVKPFDPDELVARVRVVLRRTLMMRGLNPLTGLPGNTVINVEISTRLDEQRPFACLYLDLTKFKELNDYYGFSRGDDVIRFLANTVLGVLVDYASSENFAGHIGGDDFIVLTEPHLMPGVAQDVVDRFDEQISTFYDEPDRERGWIETRDRLGNRMRFEFVSIAIGVVVSPTRTFRTAAEVAHEAAKMKQLAKRQDGSAWVVDRRRDADGFKPDEDTPRGGPSRI